MSEHEQMQIDLNEKREVIAKQLLQQRIRNLEVALDDMYFAYINKDVDNPHQFEVEAVNTYKALKGE